MLIKVKLIRRYANEAADWQLRNGKEPKGWVEKLPSSLCFILNKDGCPYPFIWAK